MTATGMRPTSPVQMMEVFPLYLITAHAKGISSVQLAKDIGVMQKTAWFMLHHLRHASETPAFTAPLKNTVEVDETYIGGKERSKHADKRTEASL